MKGVNKVLLLGNVGKDPDVRSTAGGTTVASFNVATTDKHKDRAGNWVEKTEWHSVTAFGKTAEVIRDYVKKGSHLFIEGKLQTTSWEDKDSGQKRYRTDVLVVDLVFLSSPRAIEGTNGTAKASADPGNRARRARNPGEDEYAHANSDRGSVEITDDDIPF